MSLTNLIETHSRRAASVCVLPSSTSRTARSRNSTGCGFPISDPHIFLQDMESQDDRYGNPESDQARHALAAEVPNVRFGPISPSLNRRRGSAYLRLALRQADDLDQ